MYYILVFTGNIDDETFLVSIYKKWYRPKKTSIKKTDRHKPKML
jgi:hypothetical protein